MAGNVERGQPSGVQAERTAEESDRPGWAKRSADSRWPRRWPTAVTILTSEPFPTKPLP